MCLHIRTYTQLCLLANSDKSWYTHVCRMIVELLIQPCIRVEECTGSGTNVGGSKCVRDCVNLSNETHSERAPPFCSRLVVGTWMSEQIVKFYYTVVYTYVRTYTHKSLDRIHIKRFYACKKNANQLGRHHKQKIICTTSIIKGNVLVYWYFHYTQKREWEQNGSQHAICALAEGMNIVSCPYSEHIICTLG